MGVRVDGQETTHLHRPSRPLRGQVQAVRRPVDLQRRAGGGRRLEHGIPVQVQIVAILDHAAGRVGDDVHVRAPDRVQRATGQLCPRLAAGDVDGGDDEIEAGQQVVVVVETAVGADLQLAAMQEPEAAGVRARGQGPCRLLRRKPGVEGGDDPPLQLHSVRLQAVRDPQALRVVGEHLVGMTATTSGLGHDLDGVDAIAPLGVTVQVALQVVEGDQGRQPARVPRLHLAGGLAQLGRDERQPEEAIGARLVLERAQLGGVARRGLALGIEAQEALLGQAPAEVTGDGAEPDVVLRRAGEVDETGAGLTGRHDHEVHLWATDQPDRRLHLPGADDRLDGGEVDEAVDHGLGRVGLDQQVQVAHRLAAPAQRSRLDDASHARRVHQLYDQRVRDRLRPIQQHALWARAQERDSLEDPAFRPGRDALEAAQVTRLGGPPQVVHALDAEAFPDEPHGLWPHARDPQQVNEARRDLRAQSVMQADAAGRRHLHDLVADGPAYARDRPPVTCGVRGRDVERRLRNGVRGAVVGDGLERDLALDFEDVADLVEDAREVVVGGRHARMVRVWARRGSGPGGPAMT